MNNDTNHPFSVDLIERECPEIFFIDDWMERFPGFKFLYNSDFVRFETSMKHQKPEWKYIKTVLPRVNKTVYMMVRKNVDKFMVMSIGDLYAYACYINNKVPATVPAMVKNSVRKLIDDNAWIFKVDVFTDKDLGHLVPFDAKTASRRWRVHAFAVLREYGYKTRQITVTDQGIRFQQYLIYKDDKFNPYKGPELMRIAEAQKTKYFGVTF